MDKQTLKEISETHDWSREGELWTCSKCKLSTISAHVWGDEEWVKSAVRCTGTTNRGRYVG